MANPSTVAKAGSLHLPPGFRFHPTDEELVLQYLKRKAFSFPLPASIIPEIDLGRYNPWDLPGAGEQERYFFSLREAKFAKGRRANRAMGSGYWKATGKEKPVFASKSNRVVGLKKVLVFHLGSPSDGCKTSWFMHEFCLAGSDSAAGVSGFGKRNKLVLSTGQCRMDWVLCRIFLKRKAGGCLHHQHPDRILSSSSSRSSSRLRFSSASNFSTGLSCVTESSEEVSSHG